MDNKSRKARELSLIRDAEFKLNSGNKKDVLSKLQLLRASGSVLIIPSVLNLYEKNKDEEIRKEVINFLGDLKDQKAVSIIANYLEVHLKEQDLTQLIATCWQNGMDYSKHLKIFVKCFISGGYEQSLESFTVIEEMLWRSAFEEITACLEILLNHQSEITEVKIPLYRELIKILNEGATQNKNEFPDLYLN